MPFQPISSLPLLAPGILILSVNGFSIRAMSPVTRMTVEQSSDRDYTHVMYWQLYNRYLLCNYALVNGKPSEGKLTCESKFQVLGNNALAAKTMSYEFDLRSSTIAVFESQ